MANPLLALQVEPANIDVAGSMARGQEMQTARLGNILTQYKLQQAQAADQRTNTLAALTQRLGPGLASGDKNALDEYARADPSGAQDLRGKALTQQKSLGEIEGADFDLGRKKADRLAALNGAVIDAPDEVKPLAYQWAREQLKAEGFDVSKAPEMYTPDMLPKLQASREAALDAKQQIDAHLAQQKADADKAKDARDFGYRKENDAANRGVTIRGQDMVDARARASETANGATTSELGATDADSGSILAQTGLSMPAYLALTGRAAQLPRDKATRDAAFKMAQDFANKRGVDVATLASQFKASNETLESNIKRVNQTKIMEDELAGTIDNLKPLAEAAGLGKLRLANVAKVWAGQETNDPIVQNYAFQLNQLRSELAAYNGALQGRSGASLTQQDYAEAERVIKGGLSAKGADGLKAAVSSATDKMSGVLNKSVDVARKQVWDLFGVGDKYKPKFATPPAPGGGGAKFLGFENQ